MSPRPAGQGAHRPGPARLGGERHAAVQGADAARRAGHGHGRVRAHRRPGRAAPGRARPPRRATGDGEPRQTPASKPADRRLRRQRTGASSGLAGARAGLGSKDSTNIPRPQRRVSTTTRRHRLSTPPLAGAPASILARTEAPQAPHDGRQVFQRLLRHRIIFLGQQVDDDLANRICAELMLLAAEDGKRDISLYINSPGGSVTRRHGDLRHDAVRAERRRAPYAMGMAASMGQFLLCAGTHGKRYALPHAQILLHQPHGGIGGTASDIRDPGRADPDTEAGAGRADRVPHRPDAWSRSRPTRTATAGSPRTRRRTTAWSTTWSAAPTRFPPRDLFPDPRPSEEHTS